ncbi:unnamed protein product [Mytilus edulis]|uniref:TRPM SLOG domain-containing protein n=1 Tax=Mytilus edulis TaxID=6550 RepID=A0A8S3RXW1_MYTED|nr:unnamed protein product [Mytilus edulis]
MFNGKNDHQNKVYDTHCISIIEGTIIHIVLQYIDLTRKDKKTKTLLLEDLPLRWQMPAPQAVLSITGIDHQFDIKDKYSLKRDLIDAVISTGSWVVTCGTELGVVRFIEEAINAHVAMKKLHIPIVGILSKRVNKEMIKEQKPKETISIKKRNETNWNTIPCYSTNEVLDPIHTQFIFTDDPNGNPIGSDEACREAYEHFYPPSTPKNRVFYSPSIYNELNVYNNASFKRDSNHASTTLSESKTKNRKDIKELIDEYFEEESEELRNKATETATNCLLNINLFKNDNNKKKYFLALKYSFNELVEHVDYMPIADQGRLKLQLNGLREEFNNVHFERVNKKPYFLTLKESFDKLLKQMSVDDYKKSKFKMKFKEIEIEFDDMEIVNEKEMVELENEIHKEMTKGANKFLIFLYNQFKDDVSQLKEANKANYCMDKNKVKYFTNVSTSLTKVMESMEVEFGKDKEEKTFRMTIQELVDENEKDGVSELFQSTLIANRTDFVILMLDKIEHMSAFVLGYLPNVFRLCIDTDDDAVIQLIDQIQLERKETTAQKERNYS